MRVLELFASVGGGILGSRLLGHSIVAAVESDPYRREILLRRQEERFLPPFPVWDDVRTFDGRPFDGVVDAVSAGFPCQPFSLAGHARGADDERNLWPETLRIVREVRPRVVFLENVPGLVRSYLGVVLGGLAELGFDAEWCVLGADDVGLPHRRKRLWILAAHPDRIDVRSERRRSEPGAAEVHAGEDGVPAAHPDRGRLEEHEELDSERRRGEYRPFRFNPLRCREEGSLLQALAEFQGMDDGLACRVDRTRAVGDGQVPLTYALAWRTLWDRLARG